VRTPALLMSEAAMGQLAQVQYRLLQDQSLDSWSRTRSCMQPLLLHHGGNCLCCGACRRPPTFLLPYPMFCAVFSV
jgi:hypothetical protein